jgi:hypothetical protein
MYPVILCILNTSHLFLSLSHSLSLSLIQLFPSPTLISFCAKKMCWQRWKAMAMTVVLLQLSSSMEIFCLSSHADRIHKLPGQPQIGFQHFSGYVTVDEKKHRYLFYYFVESQTDPSSKPLVLWLNGGPQSLTCHNYTTLINS